MSTRPGQTGSITLLVVAMAGVLLFLGAALTVVTALVAAHRAAQSAADLAALAAARGLASGGDGCAVARTVAAANGARITACVAAGRVVDVEVEVPGPRWLGQSADLAARSRAGPAP
ncbi:MAG TPA: Rv3654c family TadE-like protein [Nocardioides sp.]|nr:Rv3654c family TadE-like protein [Nocardioides sp.]